MSVEWIDRRKMYFFYAFQWRKTAFRTIKSLVDDIFFFSFTCRFSRTMSFNWKYWQITTKTVSTLFHLFLHRIFHHPNFWAKEWCLSQSFNIEPSSNFLSLSLNDVSKFRIEWWRWVKTRIKLSERFTQNEWEKEKAKNKNKWKILCDFCGEEIAQRIK